MSNVTSYQSEIQLGFNTFLLAQSLSDKTITNYLSDVKNFLDWTEGLFANAGITTTNSATFLSEVTPECLSEYRDSQILDGTPTATVNRRLSAVRMLFKWAQQSGMVSSNPTLALRNSISGKPQKGQTMESLLGAYEQSLRQQGTADITIKNYVTDTRGFLQWLTKQKPNPIT